MATLEDALASTLRELRRQRGYTRAQVAYALGAKTESAVARWETTGTGNRTPGPSELANLAAVYQTTPEALFGARAVKEATKAVSVDVVKRARQLERQINRRKEKGDA